jgi:WD40 repeat protein
MLAHLLFAAFLSTPTLQQPAVYAVIPVEKKCIASDAQFSPDGKTLAFIESSRIVLWDVAKKERTAAFETEGSYRQMVWSPDGKAIYVTDLGGVYRVDVTTGKRAGLYGHEAPWVTALKYLPDTKQLVSAAWDGLVVWDAAKDKQVKKLTLPQDAKAMDVHPVPGTSKLVVAATDVILRTEGPNGIVLHGMSEANMEKIWENAKANNSKTILDGETVLYVADLADGTFVTALEKAPVSEDQRQLAASHAGGGYALADPDKGVVITDLTTGKSRTIKDCPIRPLACRFSPSDRYLFAGGCVKDGRLFNVLKGAIAVYDLTAEEWVGQWATKGMAVYDLSYSAAANLLTCTSAASVDRQITVWDMKGVIDPDAKPKRK